MPLSSLLALMLLAVGLFDQSAYWLEIPFVPQTENGCGAACIVMVLRYWQPQAAVEEPAAILRNLFDERVNGIPAIRMEGYFRMRGFRTFAFRGAWQDLLQNLARGRPLIACLRNHGSSQAHYVVIAGIDQRQQLVQINDPARRKLMKVHREDFERAWHACDSWTLLAIPLKDP
jgi:ABC-type bacteriocin/lantibiotic exporter with double-glycine peptidase domain